MIAKRLLFTGYGTAHLQRHIDYAIELGATVLHAGYGPIYQARVPAGYEFVQIGEDVPPDARLMGLTREEYAEIVPREAARLAAAAADFAPDLCHAVGLDLAFHFALQAGIRPLLGSALGFLESWVYKAPELRWFDEPLAQADALIVEPPVMVELMRGLLPSVAIHELAIGLNGRHFRPLDSAARVKLRRALQLPPDATVILSPRGLGRSYNHDYVLNAFAQALPDLPAPAFLLLVQMGRTGDSAKTLAYMEERKQQATALGISDHIRWLPAFPEMTMPTLYNVPDLVISYRTPDTFPSSVLEVMACERPVIVPELPTFPGSVIAEHGRVVPPQNVDALAAVMIEMIRQPPSAHALAAARQAVLARYDKPVVIQRMETIYNALVAPAVPAAQ